MENFWPSKFYGPHGSASLLIRKSQETENCVQVHLDLDQKVLWVSKLDPVADNQKI